MSSAALRACVPLVLVLGCAAPSGGSHGERTAATAAFDVEHYAIDLELDPVGRSVRGACRIRLWPTHEPIDDVELDLVGLRVDAVVDLDGRALAFEQDDDSVRVELPRRVPLDACAEFTVSYSGRPATGVYFAAERDGVPTQVYTHGECVDARAWFPCQDQPWERATSEVSLRVPVGWKVYAAGERVERREEGATAFERWRTSFPHPAYLETFVAGEFATLESSWDGIPLAFAAAPRLGPQLAGTFAETDEILAFLSTATGVRYPYPKYAQIAVDGFQYGGMENLSATTLVDSAVTDAAGLADAPSSGLVAHEAAHQWFGDLVTCADWSHAWLNEGFATYFAGLYTESSRGRDAFLVDMDAQREGWLARDQGANRRPMVYCAPGNPILSFFSGHVYAGGAARLHHLRRLLGDEAFFRGVRLYLGENMGRGVVTEDLRRALETASGRDLRAHFERWFESPGHPCVRFAARYDAERREIAVDVEQTQEDAPFPCLVEVEIADESGVRVERAELDGRSERFAFPQSKAPRWVRLDPACALPAEIAESRTFDEWLAILAGAPDAAGRRDAAMFLAGHLRSKTTETGLRAAITAGFAAALERDPSEAVRLFVAWCATPPLADGRASFVARARREADVRAAAMRALEPAQADRAGGGDRAGRDRDGMGYAATNSTLALLVRAGPGDVRAALGGLSRASPTRREARVLGDRAPARPAFGRPDARGRARRDPAGRAAARGDRGARRMRHPERRGRARGPARAARPVARPVAARRDPGAVGRSDAGSPRALRRTRSAHLGRPRAGGDRTGAGDRSVSAPIDPVFAAEIARTLRDEIGARTLYRRLARRERDPKLVHLPPRSPTRAIPSRRRCASSCATSARTAARAACSAGSRRAA